jgi:thymidylate kinase
VDQSSMNTGVLSNDVPVRGLMRRVLEVLEQECIRYCVLRDADKLNRRGGDVDLLVDKGDLARLGHALEPLGFVRPRAWGYAEHRFFLAYDSECDTWLKLDVIGRLAFGQQPVMGTSLTDRCLKDRRRYGVAFIPSAEAELVALLLHCAIEKGRFDPSRRERCRALIGEIQDQTCLSALLTTYWSRATNASRLSQMIREDDWAGLLAESPSLAASGPLARFSSQMVRIRRGLMRRLGRRLPTVRHQALTVALLAPDGAGKSTLVQGIRDSFQVPVRSLYMGLYKRASDSQPQRRPPVISFVSRLVRQWVRYLAACYHRAHGRFVLFDRYSYDAMLPSRTPLPWHSRWRRWLLAHACPAPNLLVVLDAPGEILFGRKGEHTVALLEQQRQAYLRLAARPGSLIVDATRDAEWVRREVTSFIWRSYASKALGGRLHESRVGTRHALPRSG